MSCDALRVHTWVIILQLTVYPLISFHSWSIGKELRIDSCAVIVSLQQHHHHHQDAFVISTDHSWNDLLHGVLSTHDIVCNDSLFLHKPNTYVEVPLLPCPHTLRSSLVLLFCVCRWNCYRIYLFPVCRPRSVDSIPEIFRYSKPIFLLFLLRLCWCTVLLLWTWFFHLLVACWSLRLRCNESVCREYHDMIMIRFMIDREHRHSGGWWIRM